VLNGSSGVAADKAARVRKVAARMGYEPFGPARALRQPRTSVWAVIIADIENPFFTAVVRGVEDEAVQHNHRVVLCNSDEDLDKERAYVDVAIGERMAGVIIAVASIRDSTLDPLLADGIPVVAIDRRPDFEGIDSVVVDNRSGAEAATEHLLAGGARRVACITGPARVSTANDRLAGYRRALDARGIKADRVLVRRADFRQEGGHRAAAALLDRRPRPDALFVANNLMTLGALEAIAEKGLAVPDDVALVGFDDAPWTTLVDPPLSVVAQPTYEIGRQAARLLAEPAADGASRHLVLAPELIARGSTRPIS
jgi:LacI family transcriptional regulator